MNLLDQLKAITVVVADAGDFESLARYQPRDASRTNLAISVRERRRMFDRR